MDSYHLSCFHAVFLFRCSSEAFFGLAPATVSKPDPEATRPPSHTGFLQSRDLLLQEGAAQAASDCCRMPGKQSLPLHTLVPKSLSVIGSRTDKDFFDMSPFHTKIFDSLKQTHLIFSWKLDLP